MPSKPNSMKIDLVLTVFHHWYLARMISHFITYCKHLSYHRTRWPSPCFLQENVKVNGSNMFVSSLLHSGSDPLQLPSS